MDEYLTFYPRIIPNYRICIDINPYGAYTLTMKNESGFTLIELMITLAVVIIGMVVAIPSFSEFIKDNRFTSQANSFVIAVNLARSEAIKRNLNTILCKSSDEANCTTAGGWEQGWILLEDTDSNGSQSAGDVVLKIFPAFAGGTTLRGAAGTGYANAIVYAPTGYVTTSGSLVMCDDRGISYAKGAAISPTGRIQVMPNNDMATPFSGCTG